MRLKSIRGVPYLAVAGVLLAGSLFAAPPAAIVSAPATQSYDWNFQGEASQLLGEVKFIAAELKRDATTLESYTRVKPSWQSHATQLMAAKQHINAIGERLDRLQAIRHVADPWQQQAIDAIVPVAVQLAERTEAAIVHLNENRGYLFAPAYRDHLKSIASGANQMKDHVDVFLDFANTQEKFEQLRERVDATRS